MIRALFPGTFDPIHYGHIDIVVRASKIFDEIVVAVYEKPSKNLFFTPEERFYLTKSAFHEYKNVRVLQYNGLTVAFAKEIGAKVIVRGLRVISDFEHEFRMALANKHLDPELEYAALITNEHYAYLSSSIVKEIASLGGDVSGMVPKVVKDSLTNRFATLNDD